MKAVLSSEILRPKGGRELLERWDVEVWTLWAALEGSWVALLHLNWMALRIFTTSNCERLKIASPLLITCMCVLFVVYFHLQQTFSFIAATIFPLEKIRYTQRMNVAHKRKTVASQKEDVARREVFDRDREWSLFCYVENLHGMIILCLALLHAVVPSRGDLQLASDIS